MRLDVAGGVGDALRVSRFAEYFGPRTSHLCPSGSAGSPTLREGTVVTNSELSEWSVFFSSYSSTDISVGM